MFSDSPRRKSILRTLLCLLCLCGVACAQKIEPGNRIRLICEVEPSLSVERIISPDGNCLLPLIGRVALAGKYVEEAQYELEQLVLKKLHLNEVHIALTIIADDAGPIAFSGSVNKSGSVPFHSGLTL